MSATQTLIRCDIPLLGFCASGSGVGKTTLLTRLIPELTARGVRISVVKHAHHAFDIDHPGKDSYRLREAGAVQMLLGSSRRWALMTELARVAPQAPEPGLCELLAQLDTRLADLILVEGFKQEAFPKIEIFRPSLGKPLLAETDPLIFAVASDQPVSIDRPVIDLNNPAAVADFVQDWIVQQALTARTASH